MQEKTSVFSARTKLIDGRYEALVSRKAEGRGWKEFDDIVKARIFASSEAARMNYRLGMRAYKESLTISPAGSPIEEFLSRAEELGWRIDRAETGSIYVKTPGRTVRISGHSSDAWIGGRSRNSTKTTREVSTKWTKLKLAEVLSEIIDRGLA